MVYLLFDSLRSFWYCVFCLSSMETKLVTIHGRLGGGLVKINRVCKFWLAGKCDKNPCRFMHRESLPHNVYNRIHHSPKSSSDLFGPSEYTRVQKSSNLLSEELPKKRIVPNKTLGGESENKFANERSGSGINVLNVKTGEFKKRPKNSAALVDASDPSNKTIKKPPAKVCQHWMSGDCAKGDGCQFLHSWFCGDWFSMLTQLKGHTQAICGIAFPSGSDKLYSASNDGAVHVWDCHTGQTTSVVNLGDKIGSLISEGPWICVALPNVIKAWNIETAAGFSLGDEEASFGQVYAMVVAEDMLFAGTQDGSILAWKGSTENSKPLQLATSLKGHTAAVTCLTVGEKRLYSGSMDNTIRAWDLNTLQCVHTLSEHTDAVMSLICWEEYLLTCSLDKTIKVWAATAEGSLNVIYSHGVAHGAVALGGIHDQENKPILFCACNDNTIYLYDLPSFQERGRIFSKQEVRKFETGPSGLFFTGDGAGTLSVWKLAEACRVVPQAAT